MSRKALYTAIALVLPTFTMVGCGGHSTRSITDESTVVEDVQIQQVQIDYQPEEVTPDIKESEVPTEVNSDFRLVEEEVTEQEALVESVSKEPEMTQPNQLTVYFETNKTDIKQEDFESLISHAEYLIKNSDVKLKLTGHTDQSGNIEYNEKLAMKRSKSVAQVLIDYGVQAGQIITESLGEDYPVSGFEHAVYDRRVEMEYTQETQLTER
jgi:peptidoglycan-associated lipoprotein